MVTAGHLSDDQSRVQVDEDKDSFNVFAYLKGEFLVSHAATF